MKGTKYLCIIAGLLCVNAVSATDLKQLLQHSLRFDPTLDEARANILSAQSQTKISESGHYPTLALANTQMLSQRHRYSGDKRSGPSLVGRVNVYSWGAVESEIERDKLKEGFFEHKLSETREQLGKKIAELYLTALRAKETIAIYQESLQRHQKILKDVEVIASYDAGRQSEINEALSRKNQEESALLQQEKILYSALSRLSRYTQDPLDVKDLVDPFKNVLAEQFIAKYHNVDMQANPTYLAQQKEFQSAAAAVKAAKARRLPSVDLQATANQDDYEIYMDMNWDIYNRATKYAQEQTFYSQQAAHAKLKEIELEVAEQSKTAEVDMFRNQKLVNVTKQQIEVQRNVVKDNELQFEVATRSLLNVLDAYKELTAMQIAEVTARNDFRDAALLYLVAQSRVSDWAGVVNLSMSK